MPAGRPIQILRVSVPRPWPFSVEFRRARFSSSARFGSLPRQRRPISTSTSMTTADTSYRLRTRRDVVRRRVDVPPPPLPPPPPGRRRRHRCRGGCDGRRMRQCDDANHGRRRLSFLPPPPPTPRRSSFHPRRASILDDADERECGGAYGSVAASIASRRPRRSEGGPSFSPPPAPFPRPR